VQVSDDGIRFGPGKVIYWVPVIAPGNLMFYSGTQTFPQWNGNGLISGLGSETLNRIIFDGPAARNLRSDRRWGTASAMWKKGPTAHCGCWKTRILAR
jgi:hypothetical protein